MKKCIYALAGACLLALAACNDPPHVAIPGPIDNCGPGPQPNGQPCP
jgi:hypothetical protein